MRQVTQWTSLAVTLRITLVHPDIDDSETMHDALIAVLRQAGFGATSLEIVESEDIPTPFQIPSQDAQDARQPEESDQARSWPFTPQEYGE